MSATDPTPAADPAPDHSPDPEPDRSPDRAPDRSRGLAFAGLLLGALLGLVAGAQGWWRASGGGASVSFTGNEASGGLTWALPAVLLAGALLALMLRARGKRLIAGVLALAGLGMAVTGALRQRPTDQGVRTRLAQVSLVDTFALAPTAWPWIYAVAGLLAAGGAVVMLVRAPRWPTRTARFERTAPVGPVDLADDPTRAWQALDAGEDPTVAEPRTDPPEGGGPDPGEAGPGETAGGRGGTAGGPAPIHPDVQSESSRDTMGSHRSGREPS